MYCCSIENVVRGKIGAKWGKVSDFDILMYLFLFFREAQISVQKFNRVCSFF